MTERRAFICLNPRHFKDRNPVRTFLSDDEEYRIPQCPDGHGQMIRQRNVGTDTLIPENFPQVIAEL